MHRQAVLGGHFHDYKELFWMLRGSSRFTLEDTDSKRTSVVTLAERGRLLMDAGIAHAGVVDNLAVLVGCTEEPYHSREQNDKPYDLFQKV